jgi:hypothetical protein
MPFIGKNALSTQLIAASAKSTNRAIRSVKLGEVCSVPTIGDTFPQTGTIL